LSRSVGRPVGFLAVTEESIRRIPELLDELEEYPELRQEIATELGVQYKKAGDRASALRWLRESADGGGFEGGIARTEIGELLLDNGDPQAAAAELEQIRKQQPFDPAIFDYVAEMLEARGDVSGALRWWDMAAARLREAEISEAIEEEVFPSAPRRVLDSRRRLRQQLGATPDSLDRRLPAPLRGWISDLAPETPKSLVLEIHLWREPDFALAQERWPALVQADATHADYRRKLERQMREAIAADQSRRIELIPISADGLAEFARAEGGSPEDEDIRHRYEKSRASDAFAWPPSRNSPCWCGSGKKYKVCCLRLS
jgi:tetratricopeptide (TPR) repeat protein